MQDHGQLAGHRDASARNALALGDIHTPRLERRPFCAADQQLMGCLVERGASHLVAAPAGTALHVGFAGLVERWRQAEMRADIPRPSEAVRLIDRGAERQCGKRTWSYVIVLICLIY
jgi:hypothetical protein